MATTAAGTDSQANGNESDNSNGVSIDIDAKINKAIVNHLGRFESKLGKMFLTADSMGSLLDDKLSKLVNPDKEDSSKPAGNDAGGEQKLTLKALHDQIAQLKGGIEKADRARIEAEQKTLETRMRAEVHSQFARHLGADSKHLKPYVNEYLSQFQVKDGSVVRKTVGEYGEEQFVTADKAIDELFGDELKYLVQNSKAGGLPPAGYKGLQGTQFTPKPVPRGINPLEAEFLEAVAEHRPELAQSIVSKLQQSRSDK